MGTNVTDTTSSTFWVQLVGHISHVSQGCVILNFCTLAGTRNLLAALYDGYISKSAYPVFSFRINEYDLSQIPAAHAEGSYIAGRYFRSISTTDNTRFKSLVATKYGDSYPINPYTSIAYHMMQIWAAGVRSAMSTDIRLVTAYAYDTSISGPGGTLILTRSNLPARTTYIASVDKKGRLSIIYPSASINNGYGITYPELFDASGNPVTCLKEPDQHVTSYGALVRFMVVGFGVPVVCVTLVFLACVVHFRDQPTVRNASFPFLVYTIVALLALSGWLTSLPTPIVFRLRTMPFFPSFFLSASS